MTKIFNTLSIIIACTFISACGAQKKQIPEFAELNGTPSGLAIVKLALNQIGTPYIYGGSSPRGFDCSGLVQYTHSRIGVQTPRVASDQFQASRPVKIDDLQAGDLVFFKLSRYKVNHVGIYMGQGFFIHAPAKGKSVSVRNLGTPYWKKHMIGAGRFH